jgi:hypothetical protein
MRLVLKRVLITAIFLLAVSYIGDYLSVEHRMSAQNQGDPFDVVTYPHVLAIPQKGNRVEYALDAQSPMESDPCAHSLFPHFGYAPCWYVNRITQNPLPITLLLVMFRRLDL